jgi:hypothetical protein
METQRIQSGDSSAPPAGALLAARLTAEFNRLANLVESGSNQFRGFAADELAALTIVIAEKRAEFQIDLVTESGVQFWRPQGRVLSVFREDARTKAIYLARLNRRPNGELSFRYVGFTDGLTYRTFRFTPISVMENGDACRIRVPLDFFGRSGLTLQDGPALCAKILMDSGERMSYDATYEDVEGFLAAHNRKTDRSGTSPVMSRFRAFKEARDSASAQRENANS